MHNGNWKLWPFKYKDKMSKTTKKFFIIIVLFGIIFIPQIIFAQNNGLVPCKGLDCVSCDLFELIGNVINFILWKLITPITVVALLIGGLLLLTAGGSESQIARGKAIAWNTVLGFVIAFGAWLIINTILNTIIEGKIANPLESPSCEEAPLPIEQLPD